MIEELEDYNYLPDKQTIDKMKYFMDPYNTIRGFSKHMSFADDHSGENKPWDSISRYILYQKEGILKKYANPVYVPIEDAISSPTEVCEEIKQEPKAKKASLLWKELKKQMKNRSNFKHFSRLSNRDDIDNASVTLIKNMMKPLFNILMQYSH